jgi:hypothetical protein
MRIHMVLVKLLVATVATDYNQASPAQLFTTQAEEVAAVVVVLMLQLGLGVAVVVVPELMVRMSMEFLALQIPVVVVVALATWPMVVLVDQA